MAFGRLDRNPGHQPMSDINVTPLVDVMLVLVVIFIITAPLMASSIRLDLPKTGAATPSGTPKSVTVVMDKSAQVFLNDQPVTLEALAVSLARTAAQNPDTEVQLRADEAVPYGKVVQVMGTAQKAGLNRIGFVANSTAQAPAAGKP
ncbi:MAG: biopolymer transporter ExbD [Comamonadaceae bacterium]|nr:MAG: biopolymer transporter ExbD [Comamonadaceae bacterium]